MTLRTVAALYVDPRGPYPSMPDVDCWDEARDARLYDGPHPVVAHPPCERWGRYWHGGPNSERFPRARKRKGDDGGCFAAALAAVSRWGGVLEHPEASAAWATFGLEAPHREGGWMPAAWLHDGGRAWTCCVEQGHYGHRARKATWLLAVHIRVLPSLAWGPSEARSRLDDGFHSAAERAAARSNICAVERLSKSERRLTPVPFAELLVSLARASEVS